MFSWDLHLLVVHDNFFFVKKRSFGQGTILNKDLSKAAMITILFLQKKTGKEHF